MATARRIIHAADRTGRAISDVLTRNASTRKYSPAAELLAVDLIRDGYAGAYVLDSSDNRAHAIAARAVALATGCQQSLPLYPTRMAPVVTGSRSLRAGCRVANMEFNQFHPTRLYHPEAKSFLITEALRGEGVTLQLPDEIVYGPLRLPG